MAFFTKQEQDWLNRFPYKRKTDKFQGWERYEVQLPHLSLEVQKTANGICLVVVRCGQHVEYGKGRTVPETVNGVMDKLTRRVERVLGDVKQACDLLNPATIQP